MNAFLVTGLLAIGQAPAVSPPPSTALDGVWTVVAEEINGRPATLSERDRSLAIHNNTLTLPGIAAMHGAVRLELGPRGTLRAIPAATGTGNRADPSRSIPSGAGGAGTAGGDLPGGGVAVPGTSGTGVIGGATGVYVRTPDFLAITIGDPSAATATGTGTGPTSADTRSVPSGQGANAAPSGGQGTFATVGQPPVSLVLRRATGSDAPPSTAAATPPPPPPATLRRMSSLMGSNVMLSDGSSAGQIQDLVSGDNGAIDYAVLGNNGVFTAVPFGALVWTGANGMASLPLTRAQFGTIPTFGANGSSNMTDPAFMQRLQGTFSNFRDANGQPLFNNMGNRANQSGMTAGSHTGNGQGNSILNRSANQTGAQSNNSNANRSANQPNATTNNQSNTTSNQNNGQSGTRTGGGQPNTGGPQATPKVGKPPRM